MIYLYLYNEVCVYIHICHLLVGQVHSLSHWLMGELILVEEQKTVSYSFDT